MLSRTAKLFSALALLTVTGLSLSAAKPDPAKTFAKDFAPILTKVTINGKVLFEDGKKQTGNLTVKSDKPAIIKYFFKNTGSAATTIPGRIFVHFCGLKTNKILLGADFNPNPSTTKWDKDFSAMFTRKVNLKKLNGQDIKMFVGIYFPKGKGTRLVMKNVDKSKRVPVGTLKVK